jgi:hypothetical protein
MRWWSMIEQLTVDPQIRLGEFAGRLDTSDMPSTTLLALLALD